jgi:hypothetical protein
VNKKFKNKESLIEVSIDFKEYSEEQYEEKDYAEISKVNYYLVSPQNSYDGKNKKEIEIYSKLDKFILKKIKDCIDNSSKFKVELYSNLTFRIPLTESNIKKAIEEVNWTLKE